MGRSRDRRGDRDRRQGSRSRDKRNRDRDREGNRERREKSGGRRGRSRSRRRRDRSRERSGGRGRRGQSRGRSRSPKGAPPKNVPPAKRDPGAAGDDAVLPAADAPAAGAAAAPGPRSLGALITSAAADAAKGGGGGSTVDRMAEEKAIAKARGTNPFRNATVYDMQRLQQQAGVAAQDRGILVDENVQPQQKYVPQRYDGLTGTISKEACKFGADCYNHTPSHCAKYSHPTRRGGGSDPGAAAFAAAAAANAADPLKAAVAAAAAYAAERNKPRPKTFDVPDPAFTDHAASALRCDGCDTVTARGEFSDAQLRKLSIVMQNKEQIPQQFNGVKGPVRGNLVRLQRTQRPFARSDEAKDSFYGFVESLQLAKNVFVHAKYVDALLGGPAGAAKMIDAGRKEFARLQVNVSCNSRTPGKGAVAQDVEQVMLYCVKCEPTDVPLSEQNRKVEEEDRTKPRRLTQQGLQTPLAGPQPQPGAVALPAAATAAAAKRAAALPAVGSRVMMGGVLTGAMQLIPLIGSSGTVTGHEGATHVVVDFGPPHGKKTLPRANAKPLY